MDDLWFVFDVGTSAVKAALITEQGQVVRSRVESYPTRTEVGGIVEQSVSDWWQAALTASRALLDDLTRVKALALTGQMQDLILLDADGNPVRPVILYSDTRAQSEAAQITDRLGRGRLRALTGNDQGADSLWAKILWVRSHEPDVFNQATILLFGAADALALKLTGNALTDTTTASTTGLMQLRERRWLDQNVYTEMGLGDLLHLLPKLVAGGTLAGTLMHSAAASLGLKAGLPVYLAPGDAGATTIGAGSGEIGQAYGYLGTSGWVAFTTSEPGLSDQGVFTLAHARSDQYMAIAPLLTAGGNLEWVRDLFGVDEYASLIAQAQIRPVSNLIYLPYLNGERSPFSDPLARGALIGLSQNSTRADVYRAVLEGVVYAYRHALDALLSTRPDTLMLTGGGTRSEGWCQLFADVLGLPIKVADDAENVGVRGALLTTQVMAGKYANYAPDGYFPVRMTLQPDFVQHERYEQKYSLFRAAYPALKPIFG
ncbi:MAG: FGGY family carbohydrate kinase [Anaerolineae bacterium]